MENQFLELVEENKGFSYVLGFINDEDHFIGGTGNQVWYCTVKKGQTDCWIGDLKGDAWSDRHVIIKKKKKAEEPAAPGTAMDMILARAYFGQDRIKADGRKPVATKIYEHECSHYAFSFGAIAYDISDEFGITVSFSNVDDITVGFKIRDISAGEEVRFPKLD